MLTSATFKYFKVQLKFAGTICAVPIQVSRDLSTVEEMISPKKLILWTVEMVLYWIYIIFLTSRWLLVDDLAQLSLNEKLILLFYNLIHSCVGIEHIMVIMYRKEIVAFIQRMLKFQQDSSQNFHLLQSNRNIKQQQQNKIQVKFDLYKYLMLGSIMANLSVPVCQLSLFFASPCSPRYLFSLLKKMDNECPTDPLLTFPFVLFELFFFFHGVSLNIFQINFVVIVSKSFSSWGQELCKIAANQRKTKNLTHLMSLTRLYRSLELLALEFNKCTQAWMFTTFTIYYGTILVIANYATLKFMGVIPLPGCLFYPTFAVTLITSESIVLWFSAQAAETLDPLRREWTTSMIDGWSDTTKLLWLDKFSRSCQPIRIYIGSRYFVQKSTVLSFIRIVLEQTIALMLL